ncbi:hypothetical protein ILUMI_19791 [Ignelater luminosus]|uniref:Ionotropic glutamate receptor C-terminal domain-containing protein n=1 Tax=Ignelater luminosus TaxID=2038154 RepID=A0A8K0CL00_IGNLU|nr:hypothetical protein ILUMI_19791 [Ignelater luminosus]
MQADIGVAFLPMTAVYWNYAQFATTLDVGEWVVVLKRPRASATGSGLMAPFTLNVWLLILISLLAVGPIMYLITSSQSKFRKDKKVKSISLPECMWFVYGALLKQGTVISPESDSSRLVFATWWIFITVLTAFYTANLTAFLTLSEFTLPIKNARDIATKRFPWVSVAGSVIEEASKNNLEELYNILKGSQNRFVNEDDGGILKTWVTERNYLYIAERPNVDILLYEDYINKSHLKISEYKRCTYAVTPWAVFKSPRTFAYAKKFKYGPLFDITPNGKKVQVNGRDYWLVKSANGTNATLVPVRTPSALLFQYTH